MSSKIPVTVITGFLGAGKTTLIRHLLGHAKGKRIALIINEFGDLGVDKEVLAACGEETCREEDMIELSNGCICCTVGEDFIPAMETLLSRADRPDAHHHRDLGPRFAAAADPRLQLARDQGAGDHRRRGDGGRCGGPQRGPLRRRRGRGGAPARRRRNARSRNAARRAVQGPVGRRRPDRRQQDRPAVAADALSDVEDRIRLETRPGTGLIRASNGHVDIAALIGLGLASEDHLEGRDSAHELEHGGEGHEHDDFDSFSLKLPGGISREALLGTIEDTIRSHDVLRLKGFAALPGSDARLAIQAVGPRLTTWFDRPWKPGEARETALVVIGESPLDRTAITQSLERASRAAA